MQAEATTFNFTEWKWISIKPQQIIDQFDSDKHNRNWQATLMRIIKCIYLKSSNLWINRSRKTLILIFKFWVFQILKVNCSQNTFWLLLFCVISPKLLTKKGHLSVEYDQYSGRFFQIFSFKCFWVSTNLNFFASLPPKCFFYPHQNTTSEWLSTLGHSRIARAYLACNRRITWLSRFFLEKSSKTFESSINYFNESKFLSVSYMICTDFLFFGA